MKIAGPVLVAADLPWDGGAQEALSAGDAWAKSAGVRLAVVHVAHGEPPPGAHAAVAERVQAVTGRAPGDFDVVVTTAGPPHAGILAQAEAMDAGLIVIGALAQAHPGLLGGVAERVVRGAVVPVAVVRPSPGGGVVGATDFSDPALPAIEAAAAEAARRGCRLGIVHCFDQPAPVVGPAPEVTEVVLQAVDRMRDDARQRLETTARQFGAEALFRDGPAAAAILELAASFPAELVVVGTHGRTGLRRLALGSVAESVLRRAPCSVLVVRLNVH